MATYTNVKLGKKAAKYDKRTLHLADYLKLETLPTIPDSVDWSSKVKQWGLFANDRLGDCTAAGCAHMLEIWSANATTEIVPTDNDVITMYSAVSGYNPQTGDDDNGAVEIDVLNYWRKTGVAGHQIDAYAALEPKNHFHVQASVYLFGGVYLGLALPLSAQNQSIWSVPSWGVTGNGEPGSWGGHCVNVVSVDNNYITVVTWGTLQKMSWQFFESYCDEAYAVLSRDFINAQNIAPNSIDWTSLQQDLSKVIQ
jgi:hypothetical protein